MTPGQAKVADYIGSNLEKVCYQTIAQIAKESSVSETTVIRFSYAMGYSSFSDMQAALRDEQLGGGHGLSGKDSDADEAANSYQAIVRNDIAELQMLESRLQYDDIENAAKIIADAEQVYSIGFRISSVAATWFANTAQVLRPNVKCISSWNNAYSLAIDADEKTVAVVILYSRYSTQTVMLSNYIKSRGGKLIVITDSVTSPLAGIADYLFIAPPNRMVAQFNCIPAAFTMLNILLEGVTKNRTDYKSRLKEQDVLVSAGNYMVE